MSEVISGSSGPSAMPNTDLLGLWSSHYQEEGPQED